MITFEDRVRRRIKRGLLVLSRKASSDEEERDERGRWTAGASAASVSAVLKKAGFDRHVPPTTVMYVRGPAGKAGKTGYRVRQSISGSRQGHVEVQAMHAHGYPLAKGERSYTSASVDPFKDLVSGYEGALHSAGYTTEPGMNRDKQTTIYVTGRNKSAETPDTKNPVDQRVDTLRRLYLD